MQLLEEYIAKEVAELRERGARVHVLGDVSRLQSSARAALDRHRERDGRRHASSISTSASPTAPGPSWCARPGSSAEEVAGGRLHPAEIDEAAIARRLYTAAMARPRPPDPHLGRDADLELPALAARLRGAVRHPRALAGLHPARSLRGHPRVSGTRPPVRARLGLMDRNLAQRIGFAVVAIPLVLAVVWYGGWPLVALATGVAVLGDARAVRPVPADRRDSRSTLPVSPARRWFRRPSTRCSGIPRDRSASRGRMRRRSGSWDVLSWRSGGAVPATGRSNRWRSRCSPSPTRPRCLRS